MSHSNVARLFKINVKLDRIICLQCSVLVIWLSRLNYMGKKTVLNVQILRRRVLTPSGFFESFSFNYYNKPLKVEKSTHN